MECLRAFIDDLSENETIKKYIHGVGPEMWARLKAEAALDPTLIWTMHDPPAGWNNVRGRVQVSYYNGDDGIDRPVKIIPLSDGTYLLLQYNKEVARYTADWNFMGYLPYGQWADPQATPDGYRNLYGGELTSAEDRLALCCYGDHAVRCYNHQTGTVLWTFGDGAPGSPGDGHLYNPRDAAWLPNGNLLVSCYSGAGSAAANALGYVVELDGTDGSLVAVRLEHTSDNHGRMNRYGCYYPTGMTLIGDDLYICSVGTDEVGRYDVSTGFQFARTYKRPSGVDADAKDHQCVCAGPGNTILVNSNSAKVIAALAVDDGSLQWYTGTPGWDAKSHPANRPHEINSVYGIVYDAASDLIYAADYGNNRVVSLATGNDHAIQYQVTAPAGYELVSYPPGYDPATTTLTVPVNEVATLSYLCGHPGALVLGWRYRGA